MAKKVRFTRASAERIARTVRRYEREPTESLRYRGRNVTSDFGRVLVCKLTEAATQGALATCEIWDGTSQAAFSATGEMIEVYFRLGDGVSGDWVYVVETVRGYECLNIVCPA